ncbi:gamma-glutamyltransferase [uncultured Hyphomicrobium sp.]|uniref:gamma-glutamyltransferase n=1 Tax=uncultured Hyphomicrobium sp. TaxID=194373 RepID=UPI0025EC152A|nr:gamma-glutamyltransferase [uncultured Hyphomicrobium sp.]
MSEICLHGPIERKRRTCGLRPAAAAVGAALLLAMLPNRGLAQDVSLPRAQLEPEAGAGRTEKSLAVTKKYLISTANPLASEAGREMLRAGGSATDAAIAAQLVLGLVEPQSSGLGGGAFLLHWDEGKKALLAYDGREMAPAAAKPDRFMAAGKPMDFDRAVHSGLSVGTPGLPRLLELAHKRHGKLPWGKLFEPALKLARDGFEISQRLYFMLRWFGPDSLSPAAHRYFFDSNGSPLPIGHRLKNPDYARTLEALAERGPEAFYSGPIADAIVSAVREAPNGAGDLTLEDLAAYKVVERPPLCFEYRKRRICGMGPPSSGTVAVGQTLGMIERFDLGQSPAAAMKIPAMHLVVEAERLAYADRDRYLADPDFVPVPAGLLDPTYIATRSALIDPAKAMLRAEPGDPPAADKRAFGIDATRENVGTSHLSVIDADGNAVALTTTIEGPFGSGLFAAGFLLNNQLTDFSFRPEDESGRPVANRVESGKRPRSSMTPTFVFDEKGNLFAALGSPGGSRIILFVVKTLVGLIDWQLDAQAAIDLPNFGSTGKSLELEYGWSTIWQALMLRSYGHAITPDLMNSGVHVVSRRNGVLEGGADPRREGIALGD